jgi:hypothetical protein
VDKSAIVPWGRLELGHGAVAALGEAPGSVIHYHGAYAVYSEDGLYRYRLMRDLRGEPPRSNHNIATCAAYEVRQQALPFWDDQPRPTLLARRLLWILLNPSTAGALATDPTLRKCMAYARLWGYGLVELVNVYAYRATDPSELVQARRGHRDVRGPVNQEVVLAAAGDADLIVGGWGTKAHDDDVAWVEHLVQARVGKDIHAIALTKDGWPRHPLYVPNARVPSSWRYGPASLQR